MLTSCSWDSFFLEDKFKCFSRTPQYFSVSLSYFFLASYKTEQTAQCCAPGHRASGRRLHGTPSTRDPRLGAAYPLLSPSSTGAAPGAWARVNARDLGPGEAPLAGRAAREVTPVPGPCSLPSPGSGSRRVSSAGHRDSAGCGRQMSAQPWHWEKPVRGKAAGVILSLF